MILQKVLSEWSFGEPLVTNMLVRSKKAAWKMAKLFKSGAPGFDFQPSDLSTLYKDILGTIPVDGMEQPVGLMLDKSQGLVLGPELVTNGDFSQGATGWVTRAGNATQAVVGGELEVTAISTSAQVSEQLSIPVVAGKLYRITGTMRASASNTVAKSCKVTATGITTSFIKEVTANGVQTPIDQFVRANASTITVQLNVASLGAWGNIGDKAYFDNISVKLLPGNHASQPTSSKQPLVTARVNLLKDTDAINYGPNWGAVGTGPVITPKLLAPDGTMTASKLVFSVTGQDNRLVQNAGLPSEGYGTASIYMRGEVGGEVIGFWNGQSVNNQYTLTTEWVRYTLPSQPNELAVPSINILLYAVSGTPTIYVANPQTEVALPSTTTATRYQAVYARRNLLAWSEDFSNSFWSLRPGATKTHNAGVGALAGYGAITSTSGFLGSGMYHQTYNAPLCANQTVTGSCMLAVASGTAQAWLKLGPYNGGSPDSVVQVTLTTTPQRFSVTGSFGAGAIGVAYMDISPSVANGTIFIKDVQVELGSVATPYQRIDATQHHLYDYEGFPIGLKFDGVDDFMSTGNIDFSGASNITIWDGRKCNVAGVQIVGEHSVDFNNNNGGFYTLDYGNKVEVAMRGTAATNAAFAAGIGSNVGKTNIVNGEFGFGLAKNSISKNGGARVASTGNNGVGPFGNYPFYIASRAGTGLFFNGTIYSLTAVGKLCTPAEITNVNKLAAKAAGVTPLQDITSIIAGDAYDLGVAFGYSQGGELGVAGSKLPVNGAINGYEVYTLTSFDPGDGLKMVLFLAGDAPQSVFNTLTVDGATYASADAFYMVDDYNPLEPFTIFYWPCLSPLVADTSYTVTYT